MDESYKLNVEWNKPDTEEYVQYDPIYVKFKSMQS